MTKLYEQVRSGTLTLREASRLSETPYTTLHGRYQKWLTQTLSPLPADNPVESPTVPLKQPVNTKTPNHSGEPTGERFELKDNGATGEVTSHSYEIKTLDDLLESGKVDLAEWEVERYVLNTWEVGAKNEYGEIEKRTLYQVKAWLRKSKSSEVMRAVTDSLLEKISRNAPLYPKIVYPQIKDGHLLEIDIPDLHLGKLCWGREVGHDYDTAIARSVFLESIAQLVAYASPYPVKEILLPIGNDFFNIDTIENTTTGGTRQDVDSRWPKSFTDGHELVCDAIDLLCQTAPVRVVMVPGNHDSQRVYYLGEVLRAYYRRCENVMVDNEPSPQKFVSFGRNLIGFTHGHNEKHSNLPTLMAKGSRHFHDAKFCEWHIGHYHHKKDTHFQPTVEYSGVTVRCFRSLSPPDSWHKAKGYDSLRSAEAILWNELRGPCATFSHSPDAVN